MKKFLRVSGSFLLVVVACIFFVFMAAILQIVFKLSPLVSTMISDGAVILIFGGSYILLKHYHVFTETDRKISKKEWLEFLLSFIFVAIALILGFSWLAIYFPQFNKQSSVTLTEPLNLILYLCHSCILAPVSEECMMRLFSYNILKKYAGFLPALITTSVLFGLLHNTTAHLIFASLFGFYMALLYERTGKWYMPIIGHMFYNCFTILMSDMLFPGGKLYVLVFILLFLMLCLFTHNMLCIMRNNQSER